jgi:hypothetical protein
LGEDDVLEERQVEATGLEFKKGKYHFELRTDGIFSRKKKVNRWYIGMKYKHKSNDIKDN